MSIILYTGNSLIDLRRLKTSASVMPHSWPIYLSDTPIFLASRKVCSSRGLARNTASKSTMFLNFSKNHISIFVAL